MSKTSLIAGGFRVSAALTFSAYASRNDNTQRDKRAPGVSFGRGWLFAPWIDLEGFRGNYEGMQAETDRLRANALREIVDQDGFPGVLQLADIVTSPDHVGETLAQTECVPDGRVLPALLGSADDRHRSLAENYARTRISCAGWNWVRTLPLDKWKTRDAATLLSQAGLSPQAWSFAENLGKDVFREYWKLVPLLGRSHLDQQRLEFACRKLVEADRPESAIGILSGVTFDKVTVAPSIVMDALTACLEWKSSNPDARLRDDTLRTIKGLFGWLQKTIPFHSDEPTRRLVQLEWEFLWLLDGFGSFPATPATLIRCLSDDPELFARLIALIFRSKEEQAPDTEWTEEQREKASHGYRLLMNWDRIPGTQSDGSVDEEQLLRWLESARSLCRESGHLEVADSKIGEMLAGWPQPKDKDAMWPCEEIRDAIEEAASDDLDRGFQIGVLNSRGVVTKSPLDGGDLERKERDKYQRWAERCDIDWPRTAASLRRVAESYEFQAQREDSRAAERAQERH